MERRRRDQDGHDSGYASAAGFFSPETSPPPRRNAGFPDPDPEILAPASGASVAYRECLRNHAAAMGRHVVDGCGEFMPTGREGTAEELLCAACNCHRNFHRKGTDGEYYPHRNPTSYNTHRTPPLASSRGNSVGAAAESSSEDLNMLRGARARRDKKKKRFRTKFSPEQKEQMREFAEKLGWKVQRQDEEGVQDFCDRNGVTKQVFKVWMHNNKRLRKTMTPEKILFPRNKFPEP